MKRLRNIISAILLVWTGGLIAQEKKDCIEEIKILNILNDHRNDTSVKDKSVFFSYAVRVTNWDDETTVSNVKLYKQGYKTQFFSEQGIIYQDEQEALMIMPQQKVAILNTFDKKMASTKLSTTFFETRNSFLDSCEVVSCTSNEQGIRTLVLKVDQKKVRSDIRITKITYEYKPEQKQILSLKIEFDKDYKIKQMVTVYKDFVVGAAHDFLPARSYILDKKGKLLAKYTGYEFIDNRDKKNQM